jgi:hypothetical protein
MPEETMNTPSAVPLGPVDRLMLAIETFPLDTLYRGAVGAAITPAYLSALSVSGSSDTSLKLFCFVLAVLAALRIVPGVIRRVVPVSHELEREWAERRLIGKNVDSYQWKKLLGIGLGWIGYLTAVGPVRADSTILAIACTVAGIAGWVVWLKASRALATQHAAVPPGTG